MQYFLEDTIIHHIIGEGERKIRRKNVEEFVFEDDAHGLRHDVPNARIFFQSIQLGQDCIGDVNLVFLPISKGSDAFGVFNEDVGIEDKMLPGHEPPVRLMLIPYGFLRSFTRKRESPNQLHWHLQGVTWILMLTANHEQFSRKCLDHSAQMSLLHHGGQVTIRHLINKSLNSTMTRTVEVIYNGFYSSVGSSIVASEGRNSYCTKGEIVSAVINSNIYVLTDNPALYGDSMDHQGHGPIFVSTVEALLDKLKNEVVAGLVLEIDKVMKSSRTERDRLFSYADNFPVLRTRPDARHGFVNYLDPRDSFYANLESVSGKRCRNHARAKVQMECTVSREDDPIMAEPAKGVIRDISPGGCRVELKEPLDGERFVHLRLPALSSARPIYSSIRWDRNDNRGCFIGVMFIDPEESQLKELGGITSQTCNE